MIIFIIISITVIIGLLIIKSLVEADVRKKEALKAAEVRAANKEKLRENKLLKTATECIVEYILHATENAKSIPLNNATHDFFVGNIRKTSMSFSGGLKTGNRPHVSPSEDYHYFKYSCWLSELKTILYTSYETEGYSELGRDTMVLFLEVLSEELKKRGCPTWNESYYDYDYIGNDVLLIWDLTTYHTKKELKSFL